MLARYAACSCFMLNRQLSNFTSAFATHDIFTFYVEQIAIKFCLGLFGARHVRVYAAAIAFPADLLLFLFLV